MDLYLTKKNILTQFIQNIMKLNDNKLSFLKFLNIYTIYCFEFNINLIDLWINLYESININDKTILSSLEYFLEIAYFNYINSIYFQTVNNIIQFKSKINNNTIDNNYLQQINKNKIIKIINILNNKSTSKNILNKFQLELIKMSKPILINKQYNFIIKNQFRTGKKNISYTEINTKTLDELFQKKYNNEYNKISSNNNRFNIKFINIEPYMIANELTRKCVKYIKKISSHELLTNIKTEKYNEIYSPNIYKLIQIFQNISYWIPTIILKQKNKNDIIKTTVKLMEICIEIYKLKNFHILFSICAGFNHNSITRLKFIWNENKFISKYLNKFNNITSYLNNYSKYKSKIKKHNNNIIPYIGIIGRNIYKFATHNSKFIINNNTIININYDFINNLNSYICEFNIYKNNIKSNYNIIKNNKINQFLKTLIINDDDDKLYTISLSIQPYKKYSLCQSDDMNIYYLKYNTNTNTNTNTNILKNKKSSSLRIKKNNNLSISMSIHDKSYNLKKLSNSNLQINKPIEQWNRNDVYNWLKIIDLEQYSYYFYKNNTTGKKLIDLSKLKKYPDYHNILINNFYVDLLGHRMKIRKNIISKITESKLYYSTTI
jgi:hypothetical protein